MVVIIVAREHTADRKGSSAAVLERIAAEFVCALRRASLVDESS